MIRRVATASVAILAVGCVLPAFSAGDGDGGAGPSTATVTTTGASGSTTATSSSDAGGTTSGGAGAPAQGGAGGGCDVDSDPDNCGRCGVSCLGGDCVSGVCQPLLLARDPALVDGHVAVGGDRVYWQQINRVSWLPTATRETTAPEFVDLEYADMIAADANGAYVTTFPMTGRVVHVTRDGQLVDLVGADEQEKPVGIVVEDGTLHWTENLGTPAPVWALGTDGGEPQRIELGLVWGIQVAVDGGDVYATYQGPTDADGGVVRLGAGGAPETVASGQRKPSALALSVSHVYWLDHDGAVWRRRRDLVGEPEPVSPAVVGGAAVFNGEMAIDGTHVYWTAPAGDCEVCGAVLRAGLGGDEPEVFADVSEAINGLAVDTEAVYWTTSAPVGLHRKAKQPAP